MDCAKIIGLVNAPQMNGKYVRVCTDEEMVSVKEHDGVIREGKRVGGYLMEDPKVSGYFLLANLEPADYRAVCLHLFGMEHEPEEDE